MRGVVIVLPLLHAANIHIYFTLFFISGLAPFVSNKVFIHPEHFNARHRKMFVVKEMKRFSS